MNLKPLTEDQIQEAVVQWLTLKGIPYTHIANEGKRTAAHNAKLKRMGVTKGWSDLVLLLNGEVAFLELKTKKGRISPEQEHFRQQCLERNIKHAYARSFKEAIDMIEFWIAASLRN